MTFGLLSWFSRWVSEGNDPAWTPQTPRQVFTGYQQYKAVASSRRARTQTRTGRTYERLSANVSPIRKVQ